MSFQIDCKLDLLATGVHKWGYKSNRRWCSVDSDRGRKKTGHPEQLSTTGYYCVCECAVVTTRAANFCCKTEPV